MIITTSIRDARVEEHVADRDHGADRRRDPDHIAEEGQGIGGAHEVVLRGPRAEKFLGPGTCRVEGAGAHRHPTVHPDDEDVQDQSGHHEPRGREPTVHPCEREQESVGAHEDGQGR